MCLHWTASAGRLLCVPSLLPTTVLACLLLGMATTVPGRASVGGDGGEPDHTVKEPIFVAVPPSPVSSGQVMAWTVTLGTVVEVDREVSLSADVPEAVPDMPASVVVPAGSASVSFYVTAGPVVEPVTVSVTATCGEDTTVSTITIVP